MNTAAKSKFSSSGLALMFVCGFGIGYTLFKSIKLGAFENSSVLLLCACVAMIARLSWKALAKK